MIKYYIPIFELMMASFEGDGVIVINKSNEENFNLKNLKLKKGLVVVDFWTFWTNPWKLYLPTLILK